MEKHLASIEQVCWKTIRNDVQRVRAPLAKIIDDLDPGKEFPLFRVRYPFGQKIIDRGILQLPSDNKVAPIDAPAIANSLRNQLQRRSVPLSLALNNASEVYYEMPDRIVSLNLFQPGHIFGLWENLDPSMSYFVKRIWSVSAGARSLYMLPKITDVTSHKILMKKYRLHSQLPKSPLDHWKIFTEIANSQKFQQNWHSEILFFSDRWANTMESDHAWRMFHNYILQEAWSQSQYWRNKITFDLVWELFTKILKEKNIKASSYLVNIVKHLVLVGTGVLPAFIAADDNDIVAPISGLQSTYVNDYKLRDYSPTIMQPHVFSFNETTPVYYSLQMPILLESSITYKKMSSVLSIMPEIMFLMDTFQSEIRQGGIQADNTPIEVFAKHVVCDYFHSEVNNHAAIKQTRDLPKQDPRLVMPSTYVNNQIFAEAGHFIRGCVRISNKKL